MTKAPAFRAWIVAFSLCSQLTWAAKPALNAHLPDGVRPHNAELIKYEAERIRGLKRTANFRKFKSRQGIEVTKRDALGNATEAVIRVLSDNPDNQISVIGRFNGWGTQLTAEDQLHPVEGTPYFEGKIRNVTHGMEYRLLLNGKQVIDPAAEQYTSGEHLNSVFWDFGRPEGYQMKNPSVDLREKAVVLAETEIYELVRKWKGGPADRADTYRFITESGVIDQLKSMGYNAVEFLPFNASLDPQYWQARYLVFGLFAPDSRFGTPDDFARMIDTFNQKGVAVVMDAVVGHFPFEGNLGSRDLAPVGPANWKKADGQELFKGDISPWATWRYDYRNPYVRGFLVDSILTMMKRYGISGVRFDNLDGIRGAPGGWEFLNELVSKIRSMRPEALLIGEVFFGENKLLFNRENGSGGVGINYRTDSTFFDWIMVNLQKGTSELDMDGLKSALRDPWSWGEAARSKYITSHDEAANRREGATGSYVATLVNGGGWNYVEQKTRAFGALGMLSGSLYMDMPQMRILQQGSFNDNPGVDWSLLEHASQAGVARFFSKLSKYYQSNPAFAFQNLHANVENHVDSASKVISLKRIDQTTGKQIYALINLSHQEFRGYNFGVDAPQGGKLRVAVDSDSSEFGGQDRLKSETPSLELDILDDGNHGKPRSVTVPYLGAHGVVVIETE